MYPAIEYPHWESIRLHSVYVTEVRESSSSNSFHDINLDLQCRLDFLIPPSISKTDTADFPQHHHLEYAQFCFISRFQRSIRFIIRYYIIIGLYIILYYYVTAIYKRKGKRCDPGNYRPVSLTSQVEKLFERIIRDYLVKLL